MADLNPGGSAVASVVAKQMPLWRTTRYRREAESPDSAKFTAELKQANSPNHAGLGQNVLYVDGYVEFQPTPFCGMPRPVPGDVGPRDNIYIRHFKLATGSPKPANADPIIGPPMDQYDSVLLPVASTGAAKRKAATAATKPSRP